MNIMKPKIRKSKIICLDVTYVAINFLHNISINKIKQGKKHKTNEFQHLLRNTITKRNKQQKRRKKKKRGERKRISQAEKDEPILKIWI